MGLSPLERGSHAADGHEILVCGSIPAGAGKPARSAGRSPALGVYPRWCGEAGPAGFVPGSGLGLSPLVRGSLPRRMVPQMLQGSIPAGAGKPDRSRRFRRRSWVYLRWCGEALRLRQHMPIYGGLSPLVRGSPPAGPACGLIPGSIPAGAGKPTPEFVIMMTRGVYPRWCGEAARRCSAAVWVMGLSPLVRGSHAAHQCLRPRFGSIPAGAGKPNTITYRLPPAGVYPRWCGEAILRLAVRVRDPGLSPLVRGSPLDH